MNAPESPRILFGREGEFTPAFSEELFAQLRAAASAGTIPKNAVRVAIELIQNLSLHGDGHGTFRLLTGTGGLVVETRNLADAASAEKAAGIVRFRGTGNIPEEIRRRRRLPLPEDAKGAGLGLLEVRRLSSGGVEVAVEPQTGGHSLLVIRAFLQH
jgi:hypothetical protein